MLSRVECCLRIRLNCTTWHATAELLVLDCHRRCEAIRGHEVPFLAEHYLCGLYNDRDSHQDVDTSML